MEDERNIVNREYKDWLFRLIFREKEDLDLIFEEEARQRLYREYHLVD